MALGGVLWGYNRTPRVESNRTGKGGGRRRARGARHLADVAPAPFSPRCRLGPIFAQTARLVWAHFLTPPTRRAPFVGLIVWAGDHSNTFRDPPKKELGLSSADPGIDDTAKHDKMWDTVKRDVDEILTTEPPPNRKSLHRVTFFLDAAALRAHLGDLTSDGRESVA